MYRKDSEEEKPTCVRRMTDPAWIATPPTDLAAFVRHLHRLLPEGSRVVVEGTSITKDIQAFLEASQPPNCPVVQPDTIWPKPKMFHLPVREDLLAALANLIDKHAVPEICDHLKAYIDVCEILAWYDVGAEDPWLVGTPIPEVKMQEFCRLVGCTFKPYKK
jgi:hypothetical protein